MASTKNITAKKTAGRVREVRTAADSADVLLLTAQRLFAEKGIDAVSMREIAREAGQRNNSALHYHYGSKETLIQAILQRQMVEIDTLRNDYLDRIFIDQRHGELRALIEAVVWPMATGLITNRVNSYNRFLAAAQIHPDIDLATSTREDGERGFRRVRELLQIVLPNIPEAVLLQRYLSGVAFVMFSLADFERIKSRRSKVNRGFDLQRAIENLIDMLAGAFAAPVSTQVMQRLADGQRAGTSRGVVPANSPSSS
ncbi:TetR family transcriptional regulator [Bordetella petrii]|nr:TetR family transcriptional regulator [Bordetella petrii]